MKEEYITAINKLLQLADEDTLDFVFQFLQKMAATSTETFQQVS